MKTEKSGLKKAATKTNKKQITKLPELGIKNPSGEVIEMPLSVYNTVMEAYERFKTRELEAEQKTQGEHKPDNTKLEELLCSVRNKLAFLDAVFVVNGSGSVCQFEYAGQGLSLILEQTKGEVEQVLDEIFPGYDGKRVEAE